MKLNQLRLKANEKGFTLIELMIVIAIIGILAAVAIPNFISYRDKAFCSAAEKDANSIAASISNYFAIPANVSWTDSTLEAGFAGGVATTGNTSALFSALSGQNSAAINGPVDAITIIVTDGSDRCPEDYMTAQAAAGWNAADGTFTKTME
jgi:type IV pilus assembly protein PilA